MFSYVVGYTATVGRDEREGLACGPRASRTLDTRHYYRNRASTPVRLVEAQSEATIQTQVAIVTRIYGGEDFLMSRVTRFLFVLIPSLLLLSGIIAVSASRARGQEKSIESQGWQPYTPNFAASQPETTMPPPNIAGCWSGDLDDDKLGPGTGFTFIVQQGKRLTKGTMIGISFPAGPSASHGITGGVNSTGTMNLHLEQSGCVVNVHGKVMSDQLTGTYSVNKACRLGRRLAGTFDFNFDPTGTTCR
jgi:hypothetical protein